MNKFIKFLSIFLIINFIPNINSSDSDDAVIFGCNSCGSQAYLKINFDWPVSFILEKNKNAINVKNFQQYYVKRYLYRSFQNLIERNNSRIFTIHYFLRSGRFSCQAKIPIKENHDRIKQLVKQYENVKTRANMRKLQDFLAEIFDSNFDEDSNQRGIDDLYKYWPCLNFNLDDRIFWYKEYLSHGMCNVDFDVYFLKALEFGKQLNNNGKIKYLLNNYVGKIGNVLEFKKKFEKILTSMQRESPNIEVEIQCIKNLKKLDDQRTPDHPKINGGIFSITICFDHPLDIVNDNLTMIPCDPAVIQKKLENCSEENIIILSKININDNGNIMLNNKKLIEYYF